MNWNFDNIFTTPPISGITINQVYVSPELRFLVYLMLIVTVVAALIFLIRKNPFFPALRKALCAAFFAVGILYAVHDDIGWATWLIHDYNEFGGIEAEQKKLKMYGAIYDFMARARNIITRDYSIYAPDIGLRWQAEYFLLPVRKNQNSDYIIVLVDPDARYDPARHTFTTKDVKIDHVEPVLVYGPDAYILRKMP